MARGVEAAGESGGGGTGLAMMGMGMGAIGNLVQPTPQAPAAAGAAAPQAPAAAPQAPAAAPRAPADPTAQLVQYKQMLDGGLITQEDFDALKKKVLGL